MEISLPQNLSKGNSILAALSEADYGQIQSNSKIIHLAVNKSFYNCGDLISHVYFPLDTVIHLITTMNNGMMAEVGVVGCEGIIGISVLMGVETMPNQVFVINSGYALKIKTESLKKIFDEGGILNKLILRYIHAFYIQTSQIVACNRLHYLESRLCRWLLIVQERTKGNELSVTQDFISQMLATRRPYITTALGNLQKQQAISIGRKSIEITNQSILKKYACECYGIISDEFKSLKYVYKSAKLAEN